MGASNTQQDIDAVLAAVHCSPCSQHVITCGVGSDSGGSTPAGDPGLRVFPLESPAWGRFGWRKAYEVAAGRVRQGRYVDINV